LDELRDNLTDLAKHYDKDVVVVEYSQRKREVNDIIFNVPGGRGKGAFIWEPLNTWDSIFEKDGRSNNKISIYDSISNEYNATQKSAH
jgi:arabinogalactan endo-1,4-beta-galactosidase